uniref:Bromo domain-containing protein n=1 Tax=Caenorhabditis tropicalis TaxID=1561998 RepID=A0A1I7UKI5_9PELO
MSTKRKRAAEVETEKDAASTSSSQTAAKKRKGRMTLVEKERREAEMAKGIYVMSKIRRHRNSAGTDTVFESFLRVPPRRHEPKYYETIEKPIDITTIQHRLKNPDYSTYEDFQKDFQLFISNNLEYYKEDSDERKDILKIQELYAMAIEKVASGEFLADQEASEDEDIEDVTPEEEPATEESSRDATPMDLDDFMLCDLLGAVLEAADSSGRLLCPPFRVLQSKEEFPTYYEKIQKPIDLKTIAQNGKNKKYSTMKELRDDLFLLFENAQQFSGKGSDIFKDAEQLKNVVREKIAKIEEKGVHPMRRAKAIRLVDALLTAVAVNDNFSEDSEEDEETETASEPMWKLYWTIRNATDDKDPQLTLADNFLELPSKDDSRSYPDYYDEIKQPVSIFMINKRLKNQQYDMKTLVADLMTMYANAFEYNLESSDVCIAAQKLRNLTIATCKQVAPSLDMSQFEPAPPTPVSSPKTKTPHRRAVKIEMDTDSEDSRTPPPQSHKRKSPKKTVSTAGYKGGRKSFASIDPNAAFTKQKSMMQQLWNTIHQYRVAGNPSYWPAGAFIELPSAKQYPEYYQIIRNPIDMKTIRYRIDNHQYPHVDAMLADVRLMFANARDFNEPASSIHTDAIQLERAVLRTYESLRNQPGSMPTTPHSSSSNLRMMQQSAAVPFRMKTPKSESHRGRKKKHPDDVDEEDHHPPRAYHHQEQRMEEAIRELPLEEQKMWRLFKSMKDVREEGTNRPLAVNFMRLPTREEFPGYYEVIKKPMDMMRIKAKLDNRQYVTLLDVVSDFMLMLSNACKFNETDSDIYKEAVSLQKALLEMKRELDTGEDIPRVQVELRTIFTSIFASVFSKKDEEGKCYSDHLSEFTEVLKANGVPPTEWPATLDQIKMNIDKCRYRRLDRLQKDFFELFERARELSKSGSSMYEAACDLQKAFIVERDARCKDVIHSNAFGVLEKDIDEAIQKEKSLKVKEENDEEGTTKPAVIKRNESEVEMEAIEIEGVKYTASCYAYASRTDEKKSPLHIFRIERTFKDEHGEQSLQGHWVYRPEETLHLASRKFMKQEVFITPFRDTIQSDRLRGTCCVVSLQTFSSKILTDFAEEDVYVCEYKYHGKPKYFSKLRQWPYAAEDEELEFTKRQKTVTPKRNLTAADSEGKEEISSEDAVEDEEAMDDLSTPLDIDRYEHPSSATEEDGSKTYFQQIRTATGKFYWQGQFVLVFNPMKPLCDVMRINKLWREKDGSEWFSGCWFARPSETIHDEGRLFFKNEVIGVYRNDETRKLSEIQRVCDVMPAKSYVKQRQTEISEFDVFVCETMVNGSVGVPDDCSLFGFGPIDEEFSEVQMMNLDYAKAMRKLKSYKLHASIPNEEVLFYKKTIKMEKELSPLLRGADGSAMPLDHLDEMMDDDTDGSESVTSSIIPGGRHLTEETPSAATAVAQASSPSASQQGPPIDHLPAPIMTPKAVKSKSGYILFSAEVRKRIMHENPDAGFGEVSKIVGIEWKKLSEEQKKHYEQRAEVVAVEKAKQDAIKATQAMTLLPGQVRIYSCKWAACDAQYEAESALLEHVIQYHTSQIIMDSENQFVCMWMTCLRNRKDGKPFPSLPRLHRHIKEKHMPSAAKNIYANQLGKNFYKMVHHPGETTARCVQAPYGQLPTPQQQQQQLQQQQPQNGMGAPPPQTNGMMMNGGPPQQVPMMNGGGGHYQQDPRYQQQPVQQHYQQVPQQQMQMNGPPQQVHQQPQQNGMYHHQGPSSSTAQYQGPPPQQGMGPPQQGLPQGGPQMQQGGHPQQQQQIVDVGRTVVRAMVPAFVAPVNQIHSKRVLHSEAYLKYIESLAQNRQKSVSRWERNLTANPRNTQPNANARSQAHWIRKTETGRPVAREEDVTKALWRLRDELLKSTCDLVMERPAH